MADKKINGRLSLSLEKRREFGMSVTAFDEKIIEQIKEKSSLFKVLSSEVSKVLVGQRDAMTLIESAILCNGHILVEGVPGVAKTTMIKAVSRALGLHFSRIQFTPDLLPSDVIGTLIYNQKTHEFETKKGPIFAHLVLADEINRAPAKVQAALLEAMQEHQVTIGSQTFNLEEPFLVFATQNPIEQEGTYKLPEAQVDRFLFKLVITYPSKEEEKEILHKQLDLAQIHTLFSKEIIFEAQKLVNLIYVDEKIKSYIVDLVFATRFPEKYKLPHFKDLILYGVSPRATLALHHAAKAHAFLRGRHFVIPDDIKAIALPVLRHRLLLSYNAEADNITPDSLVQEILHKVPSP